MLWLKSCPRCGGDLVLERDRYGPYIYCVQCGHELDVQTFQPANRVVFRAAQRREEEKVRYGLTA